MKLWSGRFTKNTDELVNSFNSSIEFDQRLYKQDIKGSIAHVKMLGKQNIISMDESIKIEKALLKILEDIENGRISFSLDAEDIHMNIETILTDMIGDTGKKLHTGRSRNDQVALDFRMYIRDEIKEIKTLLFGLLKILLKISKEHIETAMPGYTHMQRAQPVTLAHHMLAYFQMFKRDIERLDDTYKRTNIMPLGSGALAGTTYDLDREYVASLLGFEGITQNSLDGVSDRDFAIELLSCLSIIMMHLSRFCEEIIIWATGEFSFVDLDDAYSTGSSIMPQKKNPDVAELVRGKTGRVYGSLNAILVTMKSLPLAYNKDMQEDKEAVFDCIDTVKICLPVFSGMLDTCKFKKENMRKAAEGGFSNATDVADYLVKKGMPFRQAHEVSGKMVLYCIDNTKNLLDLTEDELKIFSEHFDNKLYEEITLLSCINKRNITGGPSPSENLKVITACEEYLNTTGYGI